MAYAPLPVVAYRCHPLRPLYDIETDHVLALLSSIWRRGAYRIHVLPYHRDYEFSEDCEARLLDELLGAGKGSG